MRRPPLCRILEWDTAFFGVRIGRIEPERISTDDIKRVLEWCREEQVQCLYFLCAPDDDQTVKIAEAHGFHLVDIRVDLSKQISPGGELSQLQPGAFAVHPYRKEDWPILQRIAETSYTDTRFFYDEHFTREQAAALYREWLRKSCDEFADALLVAQNQENVASGFITCHVDSPQAGRIGLVGVSDEARGAGVGQLLVRAALSYFAERGVSEVGVVTQGRNLAAQRLYQKCGFRSRSLHLWYHKWFTDSDD
ncbi:MAG TPA: GNAT family N-acetyltransferase [Pyrinomonadaceae bacterium]|jgi:dTDP-4-amino-4,6-dideoxy-D-galactose acyltransferase